MKNCLHISANQFLTLDNPHFTKKIWQELAKGFEEYHIMGRSKINKFEYSREGNIHLHLVPALGIQARSFIFSSLYMFKIIRKYKITHLLAQSSILGGFTAAFASRYFKIPLMCEIHGDIYFKYFQKKTFSDRVLNSVSRFTFITATKIRSLSSKMTEDLIQNGFLEKSIITIPNRVDLSLFNSYKEDWSLNKTINIVSIGRFVPQKGFDIAIKAVQILSSEFNNIQLTLIGGGELFQDLSKQKGEFTNIHLIEWCSQDKLKQYLHDTDIYIQPSKPFYGEAMPRTIVEAMAMGLPIIASDVGAISGIIDNNSNGLLVNPNDINDLVEKIKILLSNESLRASIGKKAYSDVQNKYEWSKVFELYRNELVNMNYCRR